jgi:16S rRNA (guanine966-N2)-methyltransferase
MNKRGRSSRSPSDPAPQRGRQESEPTESGQLRIIGGAHRGRPLAYSGDIRTRPMKDRVREAVFNLVGPAIVGKVALDLFAGTGALALEAISRGAVTALLVERHHPTARLIAKNAESLGVVDQVQVFASDTFFWVQHDWRPGTDPLVIFCSPPYDLYVSEESRMRSLLDDLASRSPPGSLLVVESDERLDQEVLRQLPRVTDWRIRSYPPAVVAVGVIS